MSMNDDIDDFGVFGLTHTGKLVRVPVFSTKDYNHLTHHLHHYIKQQEYKRRKEWFDLIGIKQKLILLPVWLHKAVHNDPTGPAITDGEFLKRFNISRWDLVFNRRYSKY